MTRSRLVPAILSVILPAAFVIAACGNAAAPAPSPKPQASAAAPAAPATASPQPSSAPALKKILLTLDFVPSGYHAPFVAAVDQGFYKAAGLDVKIVPGKGSAITSQQVASGTSAFGFADFGTAAFAVSKGAQIEAVMVPEQGIPQCIITHAKDHITTPAQLKGHTIGTVLGTYDNYYLPGFLRATHVPLSSVKIRRVPGPEKLAGFENGRLDSIIGNQDLEIPVLKSKGFKISTMCLAKYGVDTITHSVFTSKKLIATQPALVRGFVAATTKGYEFALKHPNKAIAELIRYFPQADLTPALSKVELAANLALLHTPATKSKPIGWVAPDEVSYTLQLVKQDVGLKLNLPATDLYTNQFIAQGNG